MKKITLLLLLTFICISINAQFDGPAFYKIKHAVTGKYMTVDVANADIVSTAELPNNDASQVFEIKAVGDTGNFNISCIITEFDALRANSLNLFPTTTSTPTSDTNNTRIFAFPLEENNLEINGIKVRYIFTAQTGSPRYMFDKGFDEATSAPYPDASVGYTGSGQPKATWILENLTRPLSTNEFDKNLIVIANPVKNNISIKGLSSKVKKVEVFNLIGKSVLVKTTKGVSSLNVDSSSLSSGVFILKIYGKNSAFTKKIIKE